MTRISIAGSIILVTGANRGIGKALAEASLEKGAKKIYIAARNTDSLNGFKDQWGDRVVPLELDVTKGEDIVRVAKTATDVDILINNAGVAVGGWLGDASTLEESARLEMEVNYFGPLMLLERFAPALSENGGGAVVNVSSVAGLTAFPALPTYSASKAAVHSLTQGTRMLLASQGVQVTGVYPGPVDTDMAKDIPMEKANPKDVAHRILDGIEAGEEDIFTDAFAEGFAQVFQASPKASEQQFAAMATESTQG